MLRHHGDMCHFYRDTFLDVHNDKYIQGPHNQLFEYVRVDTALDNTLYV